MADHDPLCWRKQDYVPICSMCVLIASVRADERERIAAAIETALYSSPRTSGPHLSWGMHLAAQLARGEA